VDSPASSATLRSISVASMMADENSSTLLIIILLLINHATNIRICSDFRATEASQNPLQQQLKYVESQIQDKEDAIAITIEC
jgi:hypothetical protein